VSLHEQIQALKGYKGFAGDIVCRKDHLPVPANRSGTPPALKNNLAALLDTLGADRLYAHQKTAIDLIRNLTADINIAAPLP